MSVAFGRDLIRWADQRFAHRCWWTPRSAPSSCGAGWWADDRADHLVRGLQALRASLTSPVRDEVTR
ncbi:MAG: hypothetical protein ABR608_14495 [Pseudonocardiaceae bacterium]